MKLLHALVNVLCDAIIGLGTLLLMGMTLFLAIIAVILISLEPATSSLPARKT